MNLLRRLQGNFVHGTELLADPDISPVEAGLLREDNEHEGVVAIGSGVICAEELIEDDYQESNCGHPLFSPIRAELFHELLHVTLRGLVHLLDHHVRDFLWFSVHSD